MKPSLPAAAEIPSHPLVVRICAIALLTTIWQLPVASAADESSLLKTPSVGSASPLDQVFAAERDAIDVWRVYTGKDGTSHLERVRLPATLVPFFGADNGLFKVGALEVRKDSKVYIPARPAQVMLYSAPGDLTLPEHNSPGSEMFLILRGNATLVLRDGTEKEFGPGDIVILEDKTGPGHGTRIGPGGFTAIDFSFPADAPIGELSQRK